MHHEECLIWPEPGSQALRRGYAEANPFASMGLEGTGGHTRAATREEVERFVKTADDLGYTSMGTAALLAFELCQREGDVIGTISWQDYRPQCEIIVRQHKTGQLVSVPLVDQHGPLYPELEARLSDMPRRGPLIVMRDRPDRRRGHICPTKKTTFATFSEKSPMQQAYQKS